MTVFWVILAVLVLTFVHTQFWIRASRGTDLRLLSFLRLAAVLLWALVFVGSGLQLMAAMLDGFRVADLLWPVLMVFAQKEGWAWLTT